MGRFKDSNLRPRDQESPAVGPGAQRMGPSPPDSASLRVVREGYASGPRAENAHPSRPDLPPWATRQYVGLWTYVSISRTI